MSRRVVVTGRGVVSPLGVGMAAHREAVAAGRSAAGEVPRLAALGLGPRRGAEIGAEFLAPHLGRLPRKQQKLYNRATLLGMLAAALAMEEAGLPPGAGDPERFGVALGVSPHAWSLEALAAYVQAAEADGAPGTLDLGKANAYCMRHINPLDFSLKTLPNLTAGHLAIAHDARGVCRALTESDVGGARAIGDAWRLIAEGDLDAALAGGADAPLEELFYATYAAMGLLASEGRPGLVPGEGAGLLVLEEAERARARGARAYAEVRGFATAAGDGALPGDGDARALRLAGAIEAALAQAGAGPDLVVLHGDGVPDHDAAEERALAAVFDGSAAGLRRLRTKPLHGDLGAAAPAVEALAAAAMLERGRSALVLALGLFGEAAALVLRVPDAD